MRLFTSSAGGSQGKGMSRASSLCSLLLLAVLPSMGLADKVAGDYFVRSLPGAPADPRLKMHAGHIEVTPENNGNLFFWHFQNRHIANKQRTVIWLNGGPGCSSEDGALMEIGPYRVKDAKGPVLEYNEGSWNEFANIMFVDNPVGTGFSYVNTDSLVHELAQMADQFIIFLEKWFALFPEYENDDLYLAGESFAGQHIPYISRAILERNRNTKYPWRIKGMLIGNGWISPTEQYKSYLSFAYEKGLVVRDSAIAKRLESKQAECVALLEEGEKNNVDNPKCEGILHSILRETATKVSNTEHECYNMYDVRLKDSYPSCGMNWPPDLKAVTPYLQRHDVVEALHVLPGKRVGWTECNGIVGSAFTAKNSKPSITLLPDLLKEVEILLFSGEEDLICNHIGTEEMINNMEWNGGKGFEISHGTWAPRREWVFEGEAAGFYQEARNLTYVLFHNSSHMVPFDYARRSREMLDKFMKVDITSIGGVPTESVIDGQKTPATSVGGHPNSTAAGEAEKAKLDAAKWSAYYKSGEIALVVVAILAAAWGYYIWRERRHRAGYKGLFGGSSLALAGSPRGGMGLEGFRNKRPSTDIEAADFDENELDEFHIETPREDTEYREDRYSVGSSSDTEGRNNEKHADEAHNGKGKQVEQ